MCCSHFGSISTGCFPNTESANPHIAAEICPVPVPVSSVARAALLWVTLKIRHHQPKRSRMSALRVTVTMLPFLHSPNTWSSFPRPLNEKKTKNKKQLSEALKVVLANPIFQSVETMKPLAFDAGGSQAGFRQADCTSTLNGGEKKVYKCGGNLFGHCFCT